MYFRWNITHQVYSGDIYFLFNLYPTGYLEKSFESLEKLMWTVSILVAWWIDLNERKILDRQVHSQCSPLNKGCKCKKNGTCEVTLPELEHFGVNKSEFRVHGIKE